MGVRTAGSRPGGGDTDGWQLYDVSAAEKVVRPTARSATVVSRPASLRRLGVQPDVNVPLPSALGTRQPLSTHRSAPAPSLKSRV